VARGTQHRKRRTAADAAVAPKPKKVKPSKQDTWEDQLFFARLRRHAKWVFVLLAFVFMFSFVLFGVGSGSTGISDSLSNFFSRSSSTGPSVGSAENKTEENPDDPQAWRELATALESKERTEEAIVALTRFTVLKPKNEDALQELGGLYLRHADDFAQTYIEAQTKATALQPGNAFKPAASSPLAQALQDPISAGIATSTSTASSEAYAKYIETQGKAVGVYRKLADLNPKDATTQYRFAQVAQAAGNNAEAISGYTAFLKLAPNDSLAPAAKKALKQLKTPTTAPTASASTAG
jgi:tetratricopeptide (TPR) repeat protein